jgi:hypothetical protein
MGFELAGRASGSFLSSQAGATEHAPSMFCSSLRAAFKVRHASAKMCSELKARRPLISNSLRKLEKPLPMLMTHFTSRSAVCGRRKKHQSSR